MFKSTQCRFTVQPAGALLLKCLLLSTDSSSGVNVSVNAVMVFGQAPVWSVFVITSTRVSFNASCFICCHLEVKPVQH